jgi:hypothetical protein
VVELTGSLTPVIRIEGTQLLEKFMKPTPQISPNERSPRSDGRHLRDHQNLPLTDYSYQSSAAAVGHHSALAKKAITELRTFRKISSEFFAAEAGREYVGEAILFASILGVAAWPISVLLHQLLRWMI